VQILAGIAQIENWGKHPFQLWFWITYIGILQWMIMPPFDHFAGKKAYAMQRERLPLPLHCSGLSGVLQ